MLLLQKLFKVRIKNVFYYNKNVKYTKWNLEFYEPKAYTRKKGHTCVLVY